MSEISTSREYAFDVVKFIAIAIIVLHHYQQVAGVRFSYGPNWYGGVFYWGNLVELFFIISGYFAYRSTLKILNGGGIREFWERKYLRFLPMLVICGVACLVIQYIYSRFINTEAVFAFTLWNVISSFFGFERWFDTALMINNPMWYVSVLLLCFVIQFFVTCLAKRKSFLLFAYGSMVVIGLVMRGICQNQGINFPFVNIYISRGLVCFFLGLIIAHIFMGDGFVGRNVAGPFLQLAAIILVALFMLLYSIKRNLVTGSGDTLYFTLCFLVYPALLVICKNPVLNRILSVRILHPIGGIAYNMYVWHVPLILLFLSFAYPLDIPFGRQFVMYLFLAGCFLFSAASFFCIDGPLANLISKKISKQASR